MKKIVVLFSGKGSNFAHIVKTLHREEAEIVVALTNNPDAGGIRVAKAVGIPLEIVDPADFESREAFDAEVVRCLTQYRPDRPGRLYAHLDTGVYRQCQSCQSVPFAASPP